MRPLSSSTRLLAAVVLATTVAITGPASAARLEPGGVSSGDSLFPHQGNGGYDAMRYEVKLAYTPRTRSIRGTTTMAARSLQQLSNLGLDLEGLVVAQVRVNGMRAAFTRRGAKLVVFPMHPIIADRLFTVTVNYAGTPQAHTDPDTTDEGWLATPDGAVALNEPVGAMTWFPHNNTPGDKATFGFTITAPSKLQVAANGHLVRRTTVGANTTWRYEQAQPMASYLTLLGIGKYRLHTGAMASGVRLLSFSDPKFPAPTAALNALPGILAWLSDLIGPYPFTDAGLVLEDASVPYALETQTRPTFTGSVTTLDLVHELAHQWFGDSVTPTDWGDIWLNEGFATYAEWLWTARTGPSLEAQMQSALHNHPTGDAFWELPPNSLTDPADLFSGPVYERGAMTLEALRQRVGDANFGRILRAWYADRRDGNATTAQFVALCERVTGAELDSFFTAWLKAPKRPAGA